MSIWSWFKKSNFYHLYSNTAIYFIWNTHDFESFHDLQLRKSEIYYFWRYLNMIFEINRNSDFLIHFIFYFDIISRLCLIIGSSDRISFHRTWIMNIFDDISSSLSLKWYRNLDQWRWFDIYININLISYDSRTWIDDTIDRCSPIRFDHLIISNIEWLNWNVFIYIYISDDNRGKYDLSSKFWEYQKKIRKFI